MGVLTPFEWLQIGGFIFSVGGVVMYIRLTQTRHGDKINELITSNNGLDTLIKEVKEEISEIKHSYIPRDEAYNNFVKSDIMDLKLDVMAEKLERGLDANKHVLDTVDSIKRMIELMHSNRHEDK